MWNFPPDLAVIDTRRSLVKFIIGFYKAFVQHFRSTNSDIQQAVRNLIAALSEYNEKTVRIRFLTASSDSQYGNRTRVSAVRGRRLSPLTNWPYSFVSVV